MAIHLAGVNLALECFDSAKKCNASSSEEKTIDRINKIDRTKEINQ
jgi:hypothetical protein